MGFAQAVFIWSFFTLHMSVQYRAGASITSLLLMALYGSGVGAGFLKARERYHALNPTATCVLNGQQLPRDGCTSWNQCKWIAQVFLGTSPHRGRHLLYGPGGGDGLRAQITKKRPRRRSLIKHVKAASCSLPPFRRRGRSPSFSGQVVAVRTSWPSDATLLWAIRRTGEVRDLPEDRGCRPECDGCPRRLSSIFWGATGMRFAGCVWDTESWMLLLTVCTKADACESTRTRRKAWAITPGLPR